MTWPRFVPYPEWEPNPGAILSIQESYEFIERPDASGTWIETELTGRARIVIEGDRQIIEGHLRAPLTEAMESAKRLHELRERRPNR